MGALSQAILITVALVGSSVAHTSSERCMPGKNCKPPNCRCWEDRAIPGGLNKDNTPQIIMLTFGNSINAATKHYSLEIMKGLVNPNNCPALATVFIEELNTNFRVVKDLYEDGFEVGLSNLNDTLPQSAAQWHDNIKRVREGLIDVGIPPGDLKGFRSAQLYAGGDDAFAAFPKLGVVYDSTCVNRQYTEVNNMLWPYTYDFPDHVPQCSIGRTPKKTHNGTWQMLMADLKYDTHNCPSPSACSPYIKGPENVFQFLFANFLSHYNGNREPFNLYLDPLWLTNRDQNNGTREFLEFLGSLEDAWMLTGQQAINWIKYPVDKDLALKYPPWGCGNKGTYGRRRRPVKPWHRDIIKMKMGKTVPEFN